MRIVVTQRVATLVNTSDIDARSVRAARRLPMPRLQLPRHSPTNERNLLVVEKACVIVISMSTDEKHVT